MSNLRKNYARDVYLAYLIKGARRTPTDEFPVIEGWMIAAEPPLYLAQWDQRRAVETPDKTGMSFYCIDSALTPVLNNPKNYTEKLRQYQCIIGMDASPFDNMPLVVQKSQIYLNLAITYYYGLNGIKVIPNIRIGDNRTLASLEAYPKHHLIAIGTNGFTWELNNRKMFKEQTDIVVQYLEPSGILVYGPASDYVFDSALKNNIPIYQYDSFMMKRNREISVRKRGGDPGER